MKFDHVGLVQIITVQLIRSYYTAGTQCEKSRLPIYFVHLTIAQQQLDVNVTPDKTLAFIEDEVKATIKPFQLLKRSVDI